MTFACAGTALLISTFVAAAAAQQPGPPPGPAKPDTPEIKAMIEQLRTAVGPRWSDTVHFWCEEPRANRPDDPVIAPMKIFDNVFALGNSGTTVYVFRTPAGLLMIGRAGRQRRPGDDGASGVAIVARVPDARPGSSAGEDDSRDPRACGSFRRRVIFPGTFRLEGLRVGSGLERDGELPLAAWCADRPGGTPLPKHDGEIRDGEPIVLGDFRITPVAVPGHTPGSMGFIFPVKDQGTSHTAALFGGAWLTPQILSDEALQTFLTSVRRFKDATKGARVDVLLQNHMLMVPIQEKLDKLALRKKGESNPFVVGATEYQKFLDVMEGCTRVNLARRKL